MRNHTHQVIGVSAALVAARVADLETAETAVAALAAAYGGCLPDVDQPGSRIQRRSRLERRSRVVRVVGALVRLPVAAFGALVPHRGLTHSALVGVAVGSGVAVALMPLAPALALVVAVGLAIGYLAHVLADACTPSGVPLWWPLSRRRRWLLPPGWRIATGSAREALLALVVIVAALTLAFA